MTNVENRASVAEIWPFEILAPGRGRWWRGGAVLLDLDVADPNTSTVVEDLQVNQKITVASLDIFGKTK